MAEWHVSAQYHQQRHPQAAPAAQGGPEWYSGGPSAASYGGSSYSYDMPGGGQSGGAAYGSFEDEAPLLEGERACRPHRRARRASRLRSELASDAADAGS